MSLQPQLLNFTKEFKKGTTVESPVKRRLEQQAASPRNSPTKEQIEQKLQTAEEKRQVQFSIL